MVDWVGRSWLGCNLKSRQLPERIQKEFVSPAATADV